MTTRRYITRKSRNGSKFIPRYNVVDTATGMVVYVFDGYQSRRDAWSRCRKLNNEENRAFNASARELLIRKIADSSDPTTKEALRYILEKRMV